jgi:hypothetical protein
LAKARGYAVEAVLRLRDKLTASLLDRVGNSQELSGASLEEAVSCLLDNLPTSVHPVAVRESIVDLYGRRPDRKLIRMACWRLAGNLHLLRQGLSAIPWIRQSVDEWVPAQIAHVERGLRRFKNQDTAGVWLTYVFLAGGAAGMELRKFVNISFASNLRTRIGFDKQRIRPERWPANKPFCPYLDPLQLQGLRLALFLTTKSCQGSPDYAKVSVTGTQKEHNRALILKRYRYEFPCPVDYTHPCHRCPNGRDRCPVACRPKTLVQGSCARCLLPNAYLDPFAPGPNCLNCRAREPTPWR